MAKRKPMGEGAASLFGKRTAAEALGEVTGAPAPKARRSKGAPASSEDAARWMVTTIRLKPEHWKALRDAANERVAERGGGKADASEILRDVLDDWLTSRK